MLVRVRTFMELNFTLEFARWLVRSFVANFRHLINIIIIVQILQCCEHWLQSIILFPG